MSGAYLEFYRSNEILPWRQDLSDLRSHFERRASLYRHLGILPGFLRGRAVLELGPGSGHNSLYSASLGPSRFVLVEPHLGAVQDIKELFSRFPNWERTLEIKPVSFTDYECDREFDFVFCEGLLNGLPDSNKSLREVTRYVAPRGVLVITCMDDISLFPETLRRLFAHIVLDQKRERHPNVQDNVKMLSDLLGPHLAQLKGMSRTVEGWVLDNMINPAWNKHTIFEAVEAIGDEFTVLGTSPSFIVDWRWYKTIYGEEREINQRILSQYWQNVHNFLDQARTFPPRKEEDNRRLYLHCEQGRKLIRSFETSRDRAVIGEVVELLGNIICEVTSFSSDIADSLREARELLCQDRMDWGTFSNSKSFGRLFGRGMQYLSLSHDDE